MGSTLTECWPTENMWIQQHWSARNVSQSWRFWLQRVLNNATSFYCIKVWCDVQCHWLWTRHHNNGTIDKSAKAGQCAEWRNASHTGNHKGHTHWDHEVYVRPATNRNQTESGAGQSILQCRRKSPQPTQERQSDGNLDRVSVWWIKQMTHYYKQADQDSRSRKQQTARPHTLMARQYPRTNQGGATLLSKAWPSSMKTVQWFTVYCFQKPQNRK